MMTHQHLCFHLLHRIKRNAYYDDNPVSYTHLDVYKRQITLCEHTIFRAGNMELHPVPAFHLKRDIIGRAPVSYTHLDVYKRQDVCTVGDGLIQLKYQLRRVAQLYLVANLAAQPACRRLQALSLIHI